MNIFQSLRSKNYVSYSDEAFLEQYQFADGQSLPASYIDYVHTLGYGELCGSFQIFIPLGDYANSWLTQYYNWRNWFDEILDAEVVLQEAAMASDGSRALFEHAAPFAISREKDLLFWDTRPSDRVEEYPIYTVNTEHWDHQATCHYVADNLYQCIDRLINPHEVQRIFGSHRQAYPYQFHPYGY